MKRPALRKKEPTTNLLDSVFYQSALRANQLEENKLRKIQQLLRSKKKRQHALYDSDSRNTYEWAIGMKKTSGYTFTSDPSKMKKEMPARPKTVPGEVPPCYFMYGMIIGERPVLLKNFLGRKMKKKKPASEETKPQTAPAIPHTEPFQHTAMPQTAFSRHRPASRQSQEPRQRSAMSGRTTLSSLSRTSRAEDEEKKTFMIDNKLIVQTPIGFTSASVRPHTVFSSHTSEMLQPENAVMPDYYKMRYKYILPPVSMFR